MKNGTSQADGSHFSGANKTAVILATASSFYAAQSNLSSLEGIKLEDASTLVPLAAMHQSLIRAQAAQQDQENEVGELRERTAILLARWHQEAVLTRGERLVDWEERLLDVEKTIRRREVARARDDSF